MSPPRVVSLASRAAFLAVALLCPACSTSAIIDSDPRGATVIVDGVRGKTPFTVRLPITTFGNYPIRVEMPGYEPYEGTLDREWNSTATLLSIAFPPAFFWSIHRAADLTTVQLVPVKPFPDAYSRSEPSHPMLPPLPPGMGDKTASSAASQPAPTHEGR